MAKVVLDAGHGGFDNGASYGDRREKDDNLRLTLAVGEVLQNRGIDVAYTRTTDVYNSPNEKVNIINQEGGDLVVSFHRNSSPNPNTYSGVEALIYDEGGIKQQVAENITEELTTVGFDNLGVSTRTNLAVLRGTQIPAVLAEIGFINTDEDNLLFDARFDDMVNAIATAIINALNVPVANVINHHYLVQVGMFRNNNNAINTRTRLYNDGFLAEIVNQGEYFVVHVGNFDYLDEAVELEKALRRRKYDTVIISK